MQELTPLIEPTLSPDLPPELEAELRALIADHKPGAARRRMERATGLPSELCQAWVLEHVEHERWYHDTWAPPSLPCPYCGETLKTDRARQCLSCGMDWHDPANVVRRGSPKTSV